LIIRRAIGIGPNVHFAPTDGGIGIVEFDPSVSGGIEGERNVGVSGAFVFAGIESDGCGGGSEEEEHWNDRG
jgi:hypothetical protein